jgi:DNA-binding NarL/FixJ family response regulator
MGTDGGAAVPVLVADDHPLFRGALVAFLDGVDGIDVIGEARNGEEAVALAHEHHPRVVIMDVQMPGIDGVEATRRILHEAPDTRIVILTGGTEVGHAEAAMRAGACAYVLKSREPEEIFAAILNATSTW